MADERHANMNWNLGPTKSNGCCTWEQINAALLMDIRGELQKLNTLLGCHNFLAIPDRLKRMADKADPAKPPKPSCGARTTYGSACSNTVKRRGARCWPHTSK